MCERNIGERVVIDRRVNRYLLGSVAPGSSGRRIEEMLDELDIDLDPAWDVREASFDGTDHWRSVFIEVDDISYEEAVTRTLKLQAELDAQVTMENLGVFVIDHGLPPCKRVRQDLN